MVYDQTLAFTNAPPFPTVSMRLLNLNPFEEFQQMTGIRDQDRFSFDVPKR